MRELKLVARAAIPPDCQPGNNRDTENVGKKIDTPPDDDPRVTVDPLAVDPPPDEVDEAAWGMIPLLRAAEARWAVIVSPPRIETPPLDPWPSFSVHGLGSEHRDFVPRPQ
jgi:hypothetical protein